MKSFLFTMILLGEVSFASSLSLETEQVTGENMPFPENELDSYYPQQEPIPILRTKVGNVMADQTQQMNMTSFLDNKGRRRCGFPDLDEHFFLRKAAKWSKKDLTYKIMNYTLKLTHAAVDDAIKRAFKMWSDVTPLTFTESKKNSADILIYFGAGIHTGYSSDCPFDGEGDVVAHAFYPSDDIGGDAHFDEDEKWTTKKSENEINFFLIATHEFGHSLGLQHSETKGAVMHPLYNPESYEYAIPSDPRTLRLHRNDIENIQSLYGCPKHGLCLARRSPVEQKKSPDFCNHIYYFDAVTIFQGKLLFFINRFKIQKDPRKTYPEIKNISDFWPILKCGIDAAYEADGTLYVFKGSKYRTVSGMDQQPSDPKFIDTLGLSDYPINAAAYDKRTKKTLFFSNDSYWKYDQEKMSPEIGYPKKIAASFPRIGSEVDAAFYYNGRLYLFRRNRQYKFDRQHKLLSIKPSKSLLGCL